MTEELKLDLMKKFKEYNVAEYTTKYGDYYGLMFAGAEIATKELQEQIEEMKCCTEWQTGEPIKGREIFARNIANCNLLATYFSGAWRNVWNGAVIDFNKITMWRYTGFKNNGEEIDCKELKENG